jgi:GDP-D-mannose dehydratase
MATSHTCRICKTSQLSVVLDLGNQTITSRFPEIGDLSTPVTPVCLIMCDNCSLVQLKETTSASEMYEYLYGYRSGLNEMMRKHLLDYNSELVSYAHLEDNDWVLDIGSNDATFLKYYSANLHRVGCDPTGKQFTEYYTDDLRLVPDYFTKNTIHTALGPSIRFKAVSSISMFYDLPDPVQFAKDIHDILDDNGVWTLEQSYVSTMLERNSIDTICHEHLEYYGVKQIKEIMDRANFKIIHIGLNECNGGSFRIYVVKKSCVKYAEAHELVNRYLQQEAAAQIHTVARYKQFEESCQLEMRRLRLFLEHINKDKKRVYIYGASTKGNCLLQAAQIGPSLVPYAVERNPLKFGKMTSTQIPIISEEEMRANPPDYLLVLPWHFREGIISRETTYLQNGGRLIFPFPRLEIYAKKPSVLITGVFGQIGHYLTKKMSDAYSIYGITHKEYTPAANVHTIMNDLCSYKSLEDIVVTLNPTVIIHLASITNTEDCEASPNRTLQINGQATTMLCDIIYRNKLTSRLLNASSSELYKGHINYIIQEDDENMRPISIYAIGKQYAHNIIKYYRAKYNMPFTNCVIFTTESPHRKSNFLLKKVSLHAQQWQHHHRPLALGSLDSYRNLNHAADVANAITIIAGQTIGRDYNICQDTVIKVEDAVIGMYAMCGIKLQKSGDTYIDTVTHLPVIQVSGSFRDQSSNITGVCTRLKEIGWAPTYSVNDILRSFVCN